MAYETKKQKERKEKAQARANSLEAKAEYQWAHSSDTVRHIPFGQPILVGHHSEKRHRKAIETAQKRSSQAVETSEAAKHAQWTASNAGHAITSDDPEAIIALESKLADLEAGREKAKAINKAWRKNKEQGLVDLGLSEKEIADLLHLMNLCPWMKKKPCDTTNTSANIRRIKARIEKLKAQAAEPEHEDIEGDGFTISEDKEDCRIRFYFDKRPDKETCRFMRRNGFKFSRTYGAWQRLLNGNGRYACLSVAKELFGYDPKAKKEENKFPYKIPSPSNFGF